MIMQGSGAHAGEMHGVVDGDTELQPEVMWRHALRPADDAMVK
jgi:hypothetical protein